MFKYKKGLFISLLIGLTLISSFVEAVVPDAPGSYVGVTKLSSTSVRISTKDNSNNEDGFYASLYEYASSVLIRRKEISASNDSTVYADFTGLVCNKLYSANIFAFNEDGNSSVSDTRHFNIHTTFSTTCPKNIDVPSAPGSYIGVTDINKSAVRVNFLDNANNEDGFLLFDESGDINVTIPANNTTTPSQTYVTLTGLTCNRTYTIKALAFNTNGNSEISDVQAFNIHSTFGIPCGNPLPDTTKPVIILLGDGEVTVMVGNTYVDAGATATDDVDGNITANIQVIGLPIDTSSEGNYTVTYSVSDSAGNEANVTRIINVIPISIVDKTPPVITLNGDANLTLTQGQAYNELGATALDDVDGNISVNISGTVDTATVGVYVLTYSATDVAGNEANVMRTINVVNKAIVDTTPPVITLNGDVNLRLTQGQTYNELGATAIDNIDGNVNVTVSGEVDTSTVGTYTITYTAVDSAGNRTTLSRIVNVIEPVVKYGVNIGEVQGNTATYHNIARFSVSLKSKPEANVTIPLSSSDVNEGKIQPINGDNTKLLFSPDNWNTPQMVYVKGQDENPVDTVQNYKIVLGTIISDDANYDGINPDDIDMKGLKLTLKKPTDVKFIANLPKTVNIETSYNGTRRLTYTLLEHPDGMTISSNTGWISWTAPESAEGNSYPVKIKVENREFSSEISFNVYVADTTNIKTEINGTKIIVTEEGNLKGLVITVLDNKIDLTDIKLSKVSENSLQKIPNFVTRITDFFSVKELVSGNLKIKLPLSQLPKGSDLHYVSLYSLISADGIEGEFWSPISIDTNISYNLGNPIIEITLPKLKGVFFIGVEEPEVFNSINQKKTLSRRFLKKKISDVTCTPETRNNFHSTFKDYMLQTCKIASNNNINIKVKKFGTSATATRWNGTTIEELVSWIVDAQEGFQDLGLNYDNNFTVLIHKITDRNGVENSHVLGFVSAADSRKTLHLTRLNKNKNMMQGTAVHEYFHQAQARSKINGRDLLINQGEKKGWFIEGTARWFEDFLLTPSNVLKYDDLNTYVLKEAGGQLILEDGLDGIRSRGGYQRFSFFKLVTSKCRSFDDVFREMLNINKNVDPSGIKNFINELGNANCDFGNQLGEDKNSSLESALLYYQYATIQEDNIKLLDSNEDRTTFNFDGTWTAYKRDWSELHLLNFILDKIPAYGANSFKIDFDDFAETNGTISLNIKTDKPLTVVGIRLDENGKSRQAGVENNFHFTTEAGIVKEYNLTDEDRAGGLFVTLVNSTDKEINVDELKISKISQNYTKLFVRYFSARWDDVSIPSTQNWDVTTFFTFSPPKYTLDTIVGHASGDRECQINVYDNSAIYGVPRFLGSPLFQAKFEEEEYMKNIIISSINGYPHIDDSLYTFNSAINCILEKNKKSLHDISRVEHQGYTDLSRRSNHNGTYNLEKYSLFRIYYK